VQYVFLELIIQDQINTESLSIEIQCEKPLIKDTRIINYPLSKDELDEFISRMERISRGSNNSGDDEALRNIGTKLYSSIFRDTWSDYLMKVIHEMYDVDKQLQQGLQINIQAQGEIAESTPWELLCNETTKTFFGCSESSTIVRVPNNGFQGEMKRIEPPVRVLLAGASPINRSSVHAGPEIDQIYQSLEKLEPTQAVFYKEPKTSWKNFREQVEEIKPHILHLIAHGSEDGVLFQSQDHRDEPINCEALYNFLGDSKDLRLVVLNICASENVIKRQFALYPRRIPSVNGIWSILVTRTTISSDFSYDFSDALYKALTQGKSIAQAVGKARNYLQGMNKSKGLEWSTPVLHSACNVLPFPPLAAIREIADGSHLSESYVFRVQERRHDLKCFSIYIEQVITLLENPHDLDVSILSSIIQKPEQQYLTLLPEILDDVTSVYDYPTNLIEDADKVCELTEQGIQVLKKFIYEIEKLKDISVTKELASTLLSCIEGIRKCLKSFCKPVNKG
jgi:hypothetical protein